MPLSACANSPEQFSREGRRLLGLSLLLSFTVTALDQFLRTAGQQFAAGPVSQAEHWVSSSLMTLPLFALGIWVGDWIADRAGVSRVKRPGILARSLIIALAAAVTLAPLWFERNKSDPLASAQALVTPHSHGSADLYWAGPGVIVALVCVCLVPAAICAGYALTIRPAARLSRPAGLLLRASVIAALAGAMLPLAWLLHRAAEHAYASQVEYTRALLSAPARPHAFSSSSSTPHALPVTAAPFALVYQAAHALEDGLAGQAAGLPAMAVALLWGSRQAAPPQPAAAGSDLTGKVRQ